MSIADDISLRIAQDCLGVRVRMLDRVVTRIFDEELRPHGLRGPQLNLLVAIARLEPVQPSELGGRLELEKSTLSRNVRRLEERGLVLAEATGEGNAHALRIRPKGRRLLMKAAPAWERAQQRVSELLGRKGCAGVLEAAEAARSER